MRLAVYIATAVVLASLPSFAQAGMRVCNDTDTDVRVALGYKSDGAWTSEGWWTVDSGDCSMLLGKPLDKTFYYYRAVPTTGAFERGKFDFCTGSSPFTINGDSDCEGRGYKTERFHEIALTAGTTRHTLARAQAALIKATPAPATGFVIVIVPPTAGFVILDNLGSSLVLRIFISASVVFH